MIQIASMVTVQGQTRPIVRNVMTLNTCAPIVGAEVMSCQDEPSLLRVRVPLLGRLKAGCRAVCLQDLTQGEILPPATRGPRLLHLHALKGQRACKRDLSGNTGCCTTAWPGSLSTTSEQLRCCRQVYAGWQVAR